MANYNNYSISNGKGKLYLKSAEQKDGYEKVTYGTDNKVTYHKYVNKIQGVLKYFDTKEAVTKDGKKLQFLEVTFIDGDDYNKVSVPLKNSKGNYTDEVKAIISALNSAEVGQKYTLSVVKTSTTGNNGKTYDNLNVYINYIDRLGENGKGLGTGFISFNDIPKAIKEEDEDLGTTWDWKPVNKFYAQKIKDIKLNFGATVVEQPVEDSDHLGTTPKNPKREGLPTISAEDAFETTTNVKQISHEDLPFG